MTTCTQEGGEACGKFRGKKGGQQYFSHFTSERRKEKKSEARSCANERKAEMSRTVQYSTVEKRGPVSQSELV